MTKDDRRARNRRTPERRHDARLHLTVLGWALGLGLMLALLLVWLLLYG